MDRLILESQLKNKYPSIRPMTIAGRKHQLLQRGDPKSSAIPVVPLITLLPMLPNPADIIEYQQSKNPREEIGIEIG